MTRRERYLRALRREPVDALVWAPNFDYWLKVSAAEGTLPEKYRGVSRNDIVRAVGGTIWNRTRAMKTVQDPAVKHTKREENGLRVHEMTTPVGTVRQVFSPTEGEHRSRALTEHLIKGLDDLRILRYIAEATHYAPDYEPVRRALQETGEDGIVLATGFSVPFVKYAKMDAGYLNAFYLWADHRKEVDALLEVYFRKYLEAYAILAGSPADALHTGDNMDGMMVPPDIFREYAIPFYQEAGRLAAAGGKIFGGHWCGRTESLLPLVPGCGLDAVEAIVTEPMADITLAAALDALKGEVALQGGIPAVLVCREGGTDEEFDRYVREVVLPLNRRRGFVLGMSDNVPPNADFARVERVAGLIGEA